MRDKDNIVNYAIDNKVSLEEARKHFAQTEKKEEPEECYLAQEAHHHGDLSPDEQELWTQHSKLKKDLKRLYDEYTSIKDEIDNEITEEDEEWVEQQLKDIEG